MPLVGQQHDARCITTIGRVAHPCAFCKGGLLPNADNWGLCLRALFSGPGMALNHSQARVGIGPPLQRTRGVVIASFVH
jgi:hypothetical protein